MTIQLKTIEDVYEFVRIATGYNTDIDVRQKYYVVNGKSILGVFSLDLTQPVQIIVNNGDYSQFEKFKI